MPKAASSFIPKGFSTVTPHLICSDAAAAIDFYKRAFSAIELMRLTAPNGKIAHARIQIGNAPLMVGDQHEACGDGSGEKPVMPPLTLNIFIEDVDALFEQAVAAGAETVMTPTDMFWGDRYSVVKDPAGHVWAIATQKLELTPDELHKALEAFMAQTPPQP